MASSNKPESDWREQDYTSDELKTILIVGGGLMLLLVGIGIGALLFTGDNPAISDPYWLNIATTTLGFAATVLVLNNLTKQREIHHLKDRLVHEAGSQSNERAKAAIDDLRHHNWLTGDYGLLRNVDLKGANLAGANLEKANLFGTALTQANLEKANLVYAYLKSATMQGTSLREADLFGSYLANAKMQSADMAGVNLDWACLVNAELGFANLTNAQLRETDLSGADLRYVSFTNAILKDTILHFANLQYSDLTNADLSDVHFDENTIMPDGQVWRSGMDVEVFTDANHPSAYISPRK